MNDPVTVPGYRVVRPLGVGGMASVYLAVQESLGREVALKVMAPDLAANREFTERFVKEGRITAKLSHPNLVTIFDIGSYGSTYYFAAEYIPGGTLRERLQNGLSLAESLDVVRDMALGLHYAHDKGFVHRDVKPGNILFRSDGSAVLADFGIAKSIHAKTVGTQAGSTAGTPHYMSPEQARAETVDGRSDLYALGAVLYEAVTGNAPYEADDLSMVALMHVTHPVPTLPAEHAWLQPLIDGLMAKHPGDRFATGEVYIAACDRLLSLAPQAGRLRGSAPTRQRPPSRVPPVVARRATTPPPPSRERIAAARHGPGPLLLGGAGIAAVLVVLALWTAFRPDPRSNDIAALLQRAGGLADAGLVDNGIGLSAAQGGDAVDLYRQVLALDPDSADARAGLRRIAEDYERKARTALDSGDRTGAEALAFEGLRAAPDSAGLQHLLEESKRARGQ